MTKPIQDVQGLGQQKMRKYRNKDEGKKTIKEYWEAEGSTVHGDVSNEAFDRYAGIVVNHSKPVAGELLLDVGCGSGELTERIHHACDGVSIVGMDFSSRLIGSVAGTKTVSWVQADALNEWLFADESFDRVVSFGFLQYVSPGKVDFIIRQTNRVLKTHGKGFHLDIPDKRRFFSWFRWKSFRSKAVITTAMRSWLTNTIFSDGSRWHDATSIVKAAEQIGMTAEIIHAECNYRMHVILTKMDEGSHEQREVCDAPLQRKVDKHGPGSETAGGFRRGPLHLSRTSSSSSGVSSAVVRVTP